MGISFNRVSQQSKFFEPPEGNAKMLGIRGTPVVNVWDDVSAGGRTVGWTANIDTASYSFGAVISLDNGTGAERTLSEVTIRGAPVTQLQGQEGYLHDSFIDRADVFENGERLIEWGNDSVVTLSQTNDIADFLWKEFRQKQHLYSVELPGTRYYYEPNDWYNLTIGSAGGIEFIDSAVRIYSVETTRSMQGDGLGSTRLLLREVQEAWKADSNAQARFYASGSMKNNEFSGTTIRVAARYYDGKADIYCDGTGDEDEINQAIDLAADIYDGGTVHLTKGTFVTGGAIVLKENVILEGEGFQTTIEKNGAYDGISITGGSGTEISNVTMRDFRLTRNAADTNIAFKLIRMDYTDDSQIVRVVCDDAYEHGIEFTNCDRITIGEGRLINGGADIGANAINVTGACTKIIISNMQITGNTGDAINFNTVSDCSVLGSTLENNTGIGMTLRAVSNTTIVGNVISNNGIHGITSSGDTPLPSLTISGNVISDNGEDGLVLNLEDSNISDNTCNGNGAEGIQLDGFSTDNTISGNIASNNTGTGIVIAAGVNNTVVDDNTAQNNTVADFTDAGTGTIIG